MTNNNTTDSGAYIVRFSALNNPNLVIESAPIAEDAMQNIINMGRDRHKTPIQIPTSEGTLFYFTSELFSAFVIEWKYVATKVTDEASE